MTSVPDLRVDEDEGAHLNHQNATADDLTRNKPNLPSHLISRPDTLLGLLGISAGYSVPLWGAAWGAMAAMLFDIPLSILLPNYWAHNEDVDFIYPELVGLEE